MSLKTEKSSTALKVLLNHFHPGEAELYSNYLPDIEQQQVATISVSSNTLNGIAASPDNILANLHYSWLIPVFKKFSKENWPALKATLTAEQQKGIDKYIDIPNTTIKLSPFAKKFLQHMIIESVKFNNITPLKWLPPSPMHVLLRLNRQKFIHTIDYLGLHDLAKAIPQILSPNILNKIYDSLPHTKKLYIKKCLQSYDNLPIPALSLSNWDGSKTKLEKIVHQYGLLRLTLAIAGENKEFLWHLFHIIDTGRANFIKKHIPKNIPDNISNKARKQVLEITNLFI